MFLEALPHPPETIHGERYSHGRGIRGSAFPNEHLPANSPDMANSLAFGWSSIGWVTDSVTITARKIPAESDY
jgi:hypothetical protein